MVKKKKVINPLETIQSPSPFNAEKKEISQPAPEKKGENFKSNVTFNPDKTVTYETGGKKYNLSPKEYKDFLSITRGQGGKLTPQVAGLTNIRDTQTIRTQILKGQEQAQQEQAIREELANPNISEIGNVPQLTPAELQAELENVTKAANIQSAGAGFAAEATPTVLGAAATGAAAGAVGGSVVPVLGTAAGAIAGAVVGAIGGLAYKALSNLRAEAKEDTAASAQTFADSTTNIRLIVRATNAGELDSSEAVKLYNRELSKIYAEERRLKELTKTNLNDFLSDGSTKYVAVQNFLNNGEKDIWDQRLRAAIINPNPNAIQDLTE